MSLTEAVSASLADPTLDATGELWSRAYELLAKAEELNGRLSIIVQAAYPNPPPPSESEEISVEDLASIRLGLNLRIQELQQLQHELAQDQKTYDTLVEKMVNEVRNLKWHAKRARGNLEKKKKARSGDESAVMDMAATNMLREMGLNEEEIVQTGTNAGALVTRLIQRIIDARTGKTRE